MPKMSGFDLIARSEIIRALPAFPSVLASKESRVNPVQNRADYAICNDIDIEQQLETALTVALNPGG